MSDNPSAFPTHDSTEDCDPRERILQGGMTLRDYFAGQALAGVIRTCAGDNWKASGHSSIEAYFAFKSYTIANAMLSARKGGA